MCEGTVLPHWGHLFRFGACQRFAALRVRNRILDVLRFGTPMAGGYESTIRVKNNICLVIGYNSYKLKSFCPTFWYLATFLTL